jgi:hypothetical protein
MEPSVEPTNITTILAQLVGALITALFFYITWLKDGRARKWAEEDRRRVAQELDERLAHEAEERLRAARDVEDKLNKTIQATRDAERILSNKVDENTQLSRDAFKEANGHNQKIASAVQLAAAVPELAARAAVAAVGAATQRMSPTQVEVVNSAQDPVHVTQE